MNSDDMNDAEFDAFLKGEDSLSRQLQALAQPSPSAALDAAILGQATLAMAREAANDPAPLHAVPPMRRLSRRWTVPAGIAATLLVGVLARQSWETDTATESTEYRPPAAAAALEKPPAMVLEPEVKAPLAPVHENRLSKEKKKLAVAAPRRESSAPAQPLGASMAAPPPAMPAVPAAPALSQNLAPAPAPAPAPAKRAEEPLSQVLVIGSRMAQQSSIARKKNAASAAADSMQGASPNAQADEWLALIDDLLKAGLRTEALEEWNSFRLLHPTYPVSNEMLEKISAARK